MITGGFDFIAVIVGMCGLIVLLERMSGARLFRWFPSIVLVMFASMAAYTAGLWDMTDEIRSARATVRDNLIPAMLFLMSIRFNLAVVRKLGARLVILAVASSATVALGFIIVHELMKPLLGDETPLTFGTMAAGWTGGTQNFVAVKEALAVSDAAMTYTLLMGAVGYTLWLVVVIASKPLKAKFAGFLRAEDGVAGDVLAGLPASDHGPADTHSLLIMLGLAMLVASLSRFVGDMLAGMDLLNPMIWAILVSTVLGVMAAHTSLGTIGGSDELSGVMLYIVVALIGAEVGLGAVSEAPIYILCGFMIIGVHASLLLLVARLLRVDLWLVGIASIASIGSAPSAAVVGAAFDRQLVPVAILMALIGSLLGSFIGLGVAEILLALNNT